MNKTILGLAAVTLVGVSGWFITATVDSFDYVETVDSEISQLEAELMELDAAVAAGTLSIEQATNAKIQIVKRLNTINDAADRSNTAAITPEQQAQLLEGLDRLNNILVTYKATLTKVDNTADPVVVQKKLRQRHVDNTNKSLKVIVAETIQDVEDTIIDIIITDESDAIIEDAAETEQVEETESETITEETTETEPTEVAEDTTTEDEVVAEEESEVTDTEVSTDEGTEIVN